MDFDEFLDLAEDIAADIRSFGKATQAEALAFVLHNHDMFTELQGYNKVMKIPR